MKTLSREQGEHFDRLYEILLRRRIAYDVSDTGAGKTVISVKLAKKLGLRAVVVGPPTLAANWIKEAKTEAIDCIFVSNYKVSLPNDAVSSLLIVDEGHFFKNNSQRTLDLLNARDRAPHLKYVLFLSATPYDHPRQESTFVRLIGANDSLGNIVSRVRFEHNTAVRNYLCLVRCSEQDLEMYKKGNSRILGSTIPDDTKVDFHAGAFNAGLTMIHRALIEGLLNVAREFAPKNKLILCLKYKEHFEAVKRVFPGALILNGSTEMSKRAKIIENFQAPSWEHRVIAISASVGGVGVDLDDQHGEFPRKIISLPLFISEFIQLVGRVQRRNTKTDAAVYIIQPKRLKTYFVRQLKTKKEVLARFGCKNLDFKKMWEHTRDCSAHIAPLYFRRKFGGDVCRIIGTFSCNCSNKT